MYSWLITKQYISLGFSILHNIGLLITNFAGLVLQNIQMEEKSQSQLSKTMSAWRLKQEVLKNQRNFRQLENRLLILEMQRQAKIKSIQKKLANHKKVMEVRMDRFKLKQSLEDHDKSVDDQTNNNSRIFRQTRLNRAFNIRSRSNQCRENNNLLFKEIKRQREENQKLIKLQSERELEMKIHKRNKVRLIEIECKENVDKFWKNKLDEFRQSKQKEIARQLALEEKKMEWLLNLEKSQENILQQIKKSEEIQTQLDSMMAEEKSVISQVVFKV